MSDSDDEFGDGCVAGCRPVGASVGPVPGPWDCDPYLSADDELVVDTVEAVATVLV